MGLVAAYRRDMAAARARLAQPPVPVHRLTLPTGEVEYARYGSGSATLVLHGSGGGWDQSVDWAQRRLGPTGRSSRRRGSATWARRCCSPPSCG